MRWFRNLCDFIEGLYKGSRYTYVEKGFWYEAGYSLTYGLSGWWAATRDEYLYGIKRGN